MITEDHLEQLALTWFQETGWAYLPVSSIEPDAAALKRAVYNVGMLKARLAVARLSAKLQSGKLRISFGIGFMESLQKEAI